MINKLIRQIIYQEIARAMLENNKKNKKICWKGYEMVGMKKKNGKEVPNCVPRNENKHLQEFRSRTLTKEAYNLLSESVAATILRQLGGNRFKVMTGAKLFHDGGNSLGFKFPTSNGLNYVKITLTPMDVYDIEFYRGVDLKHRIRGIYSDQLQSIFTEYTGLYTHL